MRECFAFTSICPQTQSDIRGEYGQLIMWDRQVGAAWARTACRSTRLDDFNIDLRAAKKPVFVLFHGGGFASG